MQSMNWTWEDIQATPTGVIAEVLLALQVDNELRLNKVK